MVKNLDFDFDLLVLWKIYLIDTKCVLYNEYYFNSNHI
jgi:hypothetical protein